MGYVWLAFCLKYIYPLASSKFNFNSLNLLSGYNPNLQLLNLTDSYLSFEDYSIKYRNCSPLFPAISLKLPFNRKYKVTGLNGSGKSSFLQSLFNYSGEHKLIEYTGNVKWVFPVVNCDCEGDTELTIDFLQLIHCGGKSPLVKYSDHHKSDSTNFLFEDLQKLSEYGYNLKDYLQFSKDIVVQPEDRYGCSNLKLSTGNKSKHAFIKSILSDPQLSMMNYNRWFVLDEPTFGIDVYTLPKFVKYLNELSNLLLVAHDSALDEVCNSLLIFKAMEHPIIHHKELQQTNILTILITSFIYNYSSLFELVKTYLISKYPDKNSYSLIYNQNSNKIHAYAKNIQNDIEEITNRIKQSEVEHKVFEKGQYTNSEFIDIMTKYYYGDAIEKEKVE